MKTKDNSYLEQIDKFYRGNLISNQIIQIESTPKYLQDLGARPLPIIMKQSTLAKCIREPRGSRSAHNLDRKMIESLPEQIRYPVLVIEEKKRNSFALISDYKDQNGQNMLVALKLNVNIQNMQVNEVASFYGRNNVEIYIGKHERTEIHIIDKNRAKQLASLLRLQLPTTLQALDYSNNLSRTQDKVNSNFQLLGKKNMISAMKTQFEDSTDLDADQYSFDYIRLGPKSERLVYCDDYGNVHDLYHSIVGGKEGCFYHVNNERNCGIEVPKPSKSVVQSLHKHQEEIAKKHPIGNNMEHQRPDQER